MLRKWLFLLPYLLLLINHISCSKNAKFSKICNTSNKKYDINEKSQERNKRSLGSKTENFFIPISSKIIEGELEEKENKLKSDLGQPFWGMRGKRESSEEERNTDYGQQIYDFLQKNCKNCYKSLSSNADDPKQALSPFWGNRGRRDSEDITDSSVADNPFWGNRGRRQEDEPFWGTRGRREQDSPFWGNRGRREDVKLKNENFLNAMMMKNRDDVEPFWGNRGRRKSGKIVSHGALNEEVEPFWGNRGRRDTLEPFWGSRGKREYPTSSDTNTQWRQFWDRRVSKAQLKDYIAKMMNNVENDMENSRPGKSDGITDSYYSDQEYEKKLLHLLTGVIENKLQSRANFVDTSDFGLNFKPSEPETILDDRIYAEQPRYIVVERSGRSSAEDDPFFITRGKKFSRFETPRDRRGTLEELVKSVRNDPYFIARGKKFVDGIKIRNSTISKNDFDKASELICSTIDLLAAKGKNNKVKRDINENDRDRRTIFKKLAAQLQADPYFVSRGKKNDNTAIDSDKLEVFINEMAAKYD